MITIPHNATRKQLRAALFEATLSLSAIGKPEPNMPPDAKVCACIASGALVRVKGRLAHKG